MPEEDTIQTGDENEQDDQYASPDPEDDEKEDGRTRISEPDPEPKRDAGFG